MNSNMNPRARSGPSARSVRAIGPAGRSSRSSERHCHSAPHRTKVVDRPRPTSPPNFPSRYSRNPSSGAELVCDPRQTSRGASRSQRRSRAWRRPGRRRWLVLAEPGRRPTPAPRHRGPGAPVRTPMTDQQPAPAQTRSGATGPCALGREPDGRRGAKRHPPPVVDLETEGPPSGPTTQNVDGPHEGRGTATPSSCTAASTRWCARLGERTPRSRVQRRLIHRNPGWTSRTSRSPQTVTPSSRRRWASRSPGGAVRRPAQARCRVLRRERAQGHRRALLPAHRRGRGLRRARSSLQVMSGLRFVRRARANGVPVVIVNRGTTGATTSPTCASTPGAPKRCSPGPKRRRGRVRSPHDRDSAPTRTPEPRSLRATPKPRRTMPPPRPLLLSAASAERARASGHPVTPTFDIPRRSPAGGRRPLAAGHPALHRAVRDQHRGHRARLHRLVRCRVHRQDPGRHPEADRHVPTLDARVTTYALFQREEYPPFAFDATFRGPGDDRVSASTSCRRSRDEPADRFFRLHQDHPQTFAPFFVTIAAFFVVVIGWFAGIILGRGRRGRTPSSSGSCAGTRA